MSEDKLKCSDISNEKSRTYKIYSREEGWVHIIHIKEPRKVFYGPGHVFHRVVDGDIVVLAPAPGFIWGKCGEITGYCEVSWKPKDDNNPVQF